MIKEIKGLYLGRLMLEYTYKGFKVAYKLSPEKPQVKLYGCYGYVLNPHDPDQVIAQFHTDASSEQIVCSEIKKLMENYIDFEWHQFKEIVGNS